MKRGKQRNLWVALRNADGRAHELIKGKTVVFILDPFQGLAERLNDQWYASRIVSKLKGKDTKSGHNNGRKTCAATSSGIAVLDLLL